MTYQDTCKQHIIDSLPEYEGQEVEASDLGMTLTEGENIDGSWYCNTYKAEQDLKAWFDDVGEFIEEYQKEFGEKPQWDAFTQPENFHCLMMIVGVENMLNKSPIIQDYWNKKVKLTKKLIKQIINSIE